MFFNIDSILKYSLARKLNNQRGPADTGRKTLSGGGTILALRLKNVSI